MSETSLAIQKNATLVPPCRADQVAIAVELDVDPEDFEFANDGERALWAELEEEFQAFVTKIGRVWIAD